ncbi:unnamed protein product [Linum tenue]|uniref:Uncharacterized protein n=1 Tax=Linum tenue TaxID=586396 RepID=A0AAV0H8C9_9ROSI|nr:unnamed protein product [Linum tenue]
MTTAATHYLGKEDKGKTKGIREDVSSTLCSNGDSFGEWEIWVYPFELNWVLSKKTKKEGRKETSSNKKGLGNFIGCLCLSVEKKTRGSSVFFLLVVVGRKKRK